MSPDGKRWLWDTFDANLGSQVHLAGDGLAPRVVAQMQSGNASVHAYSWTAGGAFISHHPNGIGGYILFDGPFGPVDRLDPDIVCLQEVWDDADNEAQRPNDRRLGQEERPKLRSFRAQGPQGREFPAPFAQAGEQEEEGQHDRAAHAPVPPVRPSVDLHRGNPYAPP